MAQKFRIVNAEMQNTSPAAFPILEIIICAILPSSAIIKKHFHYLSPIMIRFFLRFLTYFLHLNLCITEKYIFVTAMYTGTNRKIICQWLKRTATRFTELSYSSTPLLDFFALCSTMQAITCVWVHPATAVSANCRRYQCCIGILRSHFPDVLSFFTSLLPAHLQGGQLSNGGSMQSP